MTPERQRPGAGLPLAHGVRVALRLAFAAAVLLAAGAPIGAQVAADQPAVPAQPATSALEPTGDTVLVRQVMPEVGWWEKVTGVTSGLISIVALLLLAVLIPVVWKLRGLAQALQTTVQKVQGDVAPIMRHATSVADDVNYISTAIRSDVQQVNQTVTAVNKQLLAAVKQAEERMDEFNALLEVAQEEAETAFISTAATLRGISTGAAAFAGGETGRRGRGPRRARMREHDRDLREGMAELRHAIDEDLQDAVEGVGPALDDSFDEEELTDGDNDGDGEADSGRSAPDAERRRPGPGPGPGAGGAV
jgi:uncharacterized protein YoxC